MRIAKKDVPVKINAPGAIARVARDFGDASRYGKFGGEYFSLGAGADMAPLLKGLEGDLCPVPHWGYLIEGQITVTYDDGTEESVKGGDLFYWPSGHSVKVGQDAELIMFSPQEEHGRVIEHLRGRMGA